MLNVILGQIYDGSFEKSKYTRSEPKFFEKDNLWVNVNL